MIGRSTTTGLTMTGFGNFGVTMMIGGFFGNFGIATSGGFFGKSGFTMIGPFGAILIGPLGITIGLALASTEAKAPTSAPAARTSLVDDLMDMAFLRGGR